MKVLVTGGMGFIGSHVAKHLVERGCKVFIMDDLSGGFKENAPKGVSFLNVDIGNASYIENIFTVEKFDYVYHLAAYAAEGLSHFIRKFNYSNNLMGSINLINSSIRHKVKCFVFASSIATYGTPETLPVTEETFQNPEDPYGIAKLAVEMDLKAAYEMFGLNYVIFRPHNVYGEHQNIGDKYRNVLGIFMNQILQNKELTIFGNGEQTRAFSYIDDVAPYIAEAPFVKKAYQKSFNIGADIPYSVKELAMRICDILEIKSNIKYVDARNEVKHVHADHSLIKEIFDIKSETNLDVGIRRMVQWVKKHGARESFKFKNIEIEEKLPKGWK